MTRPARRRSPSAPWDRRPGAGASPPPLPRFRSPLRGPWLTSVLRCRPARRAARRDRHRPAQLRRLRAAVRAGDPGRRRRPAPALRSTGPPRRRGSTGSPRACTSGSGWSWCRWCWPSCGRSIPRLFAWPPVRSVAQALERVTLLMLVGGILFEIVTGLMNIQYDYVFGFSFYTAHYIGAWVFLARVRRARRAEAAARWCAALRSRSLRAELRMPVAGDPARGARRRPRPGRRATGPRDDEPAWRARARRRRVAARRGADRRPDPRRPAAQPRGAAAPRAQLAGDGGPNDFPVNKTFAVAAGIEPGAVGATWRLDADRRRAARPARPRRPGRAAAAHRDAADRVRRGLVDDPDLDRGAAARPRRAGRRARARERGRALAGERPVRAGDAHVRPGAAPGRAARAARSTGADLEPDHGYPARVVVPALPGVHNTKWVRSIEFRSS